ncbi:MAG: hypothetical protein ABI321_16500 [Polyangia bacterium]
MRTLVASALVLFAVPAFAGGRTFALSTVVNNGSTKLKPSEASVTVRAPRTTKVSQSFGGGNVFVPLAARLNSAGTQRLYTVKPGHFFVSPAGTMFSIK